MGAKDERKLADLFPELRDILIPQWKRRFNKGLSYLWRPETHDPGGTQKLAATERED